MKKLALIVSVVIPLGFLAACEDPDHYPITGQECGPDDPVKEMDAADLDCLPSI